MSHNMGSAAGERAGEGGASADEAVSSSPWFVVGMSRAATTWMLKVLNAHPDIAGFGESVYWGRRYIEPQADGRYDPDQVEAIVERLADGSCLSSVVSKDSTPPPGCLQHVTRESWPDLLRAAAADLPERPTPGELFAAACRALANGEGKRHVVEKTPHHLQWIDRMLAAYPQTKFVVMVREPYSFMLSYKHQPDRKSARVARNLRANYHPFACATVWRTSMRRAVEAQHQHSAQVLIVDHAQIREDPQGVVSRVLEFLGAPQVDLISKVPPDNSSFASGPRPPLRGGDVLWMNVVAGRTMDAAGYARTRPPFEPLHMLWSVAYIPVWAVRSMMTVRRFVSGSLVKYLMRWLRG